MTSTHNLYSIHQTNNWPSWLTWKAVIARKELQYSFTYNNQNQINTHTNLTILKTEINHTRIRYDILLPTWKQSPIEHNIRRFIRHLQNAHHLALWHSQARTQCWNPRRADTDWNQFYEFINY